MRVPSGAFLQPALIAPHRAVSWKSSGGARKKKKKKKKRYVLRCSQRSQQTTAAQIKMQTLVKKGLLLVCVSCHGVPPLVLVHMDTPHVALLVPLSCISCRTHEHAQRCDASGEVVTDVNGCKQTLKQLPTKLEAGSKTIESFLCVCKQLN